MTERVTPTQYVYRRHGEQCLRAPACEPTQAPTTGVRTIADCVLATSIMSGKVVCARVDLELGALVELMITHHIGCVPIVDANGGPVGMVTKKDLVEMLVAAPGDARAHCACDVMMPFAFTLDERATVAHAAAMMSSEDLHHVPIVSDSGCVIGVVSSLDIVRWLAVNDGFVGGGSTSDAQRR